MGKNTGPPAGSTEQGLIHTPRGRLHSPDPQHLPSLVVDSQKGIRARNGHDGPPACQALARFPFDQHSLLVGGCFMYSEQQIWAVTRPANFSPRDWASFCSQGFLGAGSSVRQCGRRVPFSQCTLSGLVLTFFSSLESQ